MYKVSIVKAGTGFSGHHLLRRTLQLAPLLITNIDTTYVINAARLTNVTLLIR
jgi:hypothetical protein